MLALFNYIVHIVDAFWGNFKLAHMRTVIIYNQATPITYDGRCPSMIQMFTLVFPQK